mgnify:FL=1
MKVLSIVSGGFDPLHVGHLELFENSKLISTDVLAIINTDDFLTNKKGKPFMPFEERIKIVQALKPITFTFKSIDKDHRVCESIKAVYNKYKDKYDKIIFCNGGDRTCAEDTPEDKLCEEIGVQTVYGLGDKIQSSSWLTQEEQNNPTEVTRLKPEDLPEDTYVQRVVKEHILSLKSK